MSMTYDDGNVELVILGGINKKTGQKNPTELLGYFLRTDSIKTKFGVKSFYVFNTKKGTQGLLGSGNLDKIMQTKIPGLLTHVVDTGETKDVGKGNPMKVFRVGQDSTDSIDVASVDSGESVNEPEQSENDTEESSITYKSSQQVTSALPNAERRAKLQSMINKNR